MQEAQRMGLVAGRRVVVAVSRINEDGPPLRYTASLRKTSLL